MTGDIIMNDTARETLSGFFSFRRIPHAIIIEGTTPANRLECAKLLARAMMCEGETIPCGECRHCRKAMQDAHPDIIFCEKESGKATMGVDIIRQNLVFTKLNDKAEVMQSDVFGAIRALGKQGRKFDIIFMDPPYAEGFYEPVLKELKKADILSEDGYVVAEAAKGYTLPAIDGFKIFKERKCGPAVMMFLNLEEVKC